MNHANHLASSGVFPHAGEVARRDGKLRRIWQASTPAGRETKEKEKEKKKKKRASNA